MLHQEQIDFFHANGFLIMPGLVRGHELELLQRAADEVQAQGEAHEGDEHRYVKNRDGTETYWRSENMWQRGDIFLAVTVNPDILENVGQCTGQPFYPYNDSLVVKLAHSGAPVVWHQDPPYMGHTTTEETYAVPGFTTDIYLDHSGPDNGCVWAVDGHHLVGSVDLRPFGEEDLIKQGRATPIEMEAGDVLFHSLSTPHGSLPNTSDIQRRIFYIAYLADELREHAYPNWPLTGWGPAKRSQIEKMIARRRAFGWETPEARPTLRLGDDGLEFVGQPSTPPRHWGELSAAIPAGRREALKKLEPVS